MIGVDTNNVTIAPRDHLLRDVAEPERGGALDPLYEAGESGELQLPFCTRNRHPLDLDQSRCEQCGAGPEWRTVEASCRVLAVIVMHRLESRLVAVDTPYAVYDVELGSGHRLYLAAADPIAPAAAIGDQLAIGWVRLGARTVPRVITRTTTEGVCDEHQR
jgi:uncharacterized OB-fold protein